MTLPKVQGHPLTPCQFSHSVEQRSRVMGMVQRYPTDVVRPWRLVHTPPCRPQAPVGVAHPGVPATITEGDVQALTGVPYFVPLSKRQLRLPGGCRREDAVEAHRVDAEVEVVLSIPAMY